MPMTPPVDLQVIYYVLNNKTTLAVPCEDDKRVHSKTCALNRWRLQTLEYRPELNRLRFCKRFDPPRIMVEYDHTYDIELQDSEGNPLGFSISDLDQQAAERQREQLEAEKQEQLAEVTDKEKERFLRDLSETTGVPIEDIRAEVEGRSANNAQPTPTEPEPQPADEVPPLTEIQEQALAEAKKQNNGKELTEEHRQHIIRATAPASPDPDADPFAEL